MDKYEYQIKLEEINKLIEKEEYDAAAKLADTIEWKRVRSIRTLCMISELYESVGRAEDSKAILYRAYLRSPNSRQILYRLIEVCVQTQEFDDAVKYYTEYVDLLPNDTSEYCDDGKDTNSETLEEKDAKNICADENGHIVIPDYIKKIGAYAFNCRKDVVSVDLPNGLTAIEESAFNACHNLIEINIPQSVVSIGADAFARCFKLNSIILPDGIECIHSGTFQHCSNLKKIIVPASLKSIDRIAFWYCYKLKTIVLTDTVNYIDEDAFNGCSDLSIIAPAGSYAHNYADLHGYTKNKVDLEMGSPDNVKGSNSMGYVFISYSSKNQQMADSFRTLFHQNGIKTWMAPGDIPFGSTYTATINRAIKDSSCFVLLLSESAQSSRWVLNETERAVSTGKTIFTVLLDDVSMNDDFEFMLSTSQAVAIRKIDESDEKIKRLVMAVKTYVGERNTKEV